MKANELTIKDLMIGDWVYNTHNRQNERVQEITSGLVMLAYNDLYEYDEIEPIPLIPEILEKNGFVVESRDCHGKPLQYCELVDGLWIDISGENFFEGKLEYVHQLQHALRLCEIEKEIIL